MLAKTKQAVTEDAKLFTGQPVCVILKDGTFYVGCITDVERDEITLAGHKARGKVQKSIRRRPGKATTSGFIPGTAAFNGFQGGLPFETFGAPAGTALQAGGGSGFGGFMGFMKQAWPSIRMGIGMIRTIMPLMGLFKR